MQDLNINIGSLSTTGYDVNIGYTGVEIGRFGSLSFNLTGTYLVDLITQPAPGIDLDPNPDITRDTYDCVGLLLVGLPDAEPAVAAPVPHELADAVGRRPVVHLAPLRRRHGPHRARTTRCRATSSTASSPAEDYFDLAANWAITEKAAVTLGINNVLDDNPTISGAVGTTGNGNTYPQTYDALGRYVFLRATVDF